MRGRETMSRRGKNVWYTIWDAATDEVLAFGDGPTCARMLGKSLESFYSTVSRVVSGEYNHLVVLKEKIE